MLEALRDETFADEHFIDDCEMKETFLKTITTAQKVTSMLSNCSVAGLEKFTSP